MKGDDTDRLRHMILAIDKIEKYTADIDFETFDQNEMIQDAVFKNLEIIGEAAYKVSDEAKEVHDNIQWRKIEGLRHKLVHDYYKVDLQVVWNTRSMSLPELKEQLERLLNTSN